jgi:hypothetical protein
MALEQTNFFTSRGWLRVEMQILRHSKYQKTATYISVNQYQWRDNQSIFK